MQGLLFFVFGVSVATLGATLGRMWLPLGSMGFPLGSMWLPLDSIWPLLVFHLAPSGLHLGTLEAPGGSLWTSIWMTLGYPRRPWLPEGFWDHSRVLRWPAEVASLA